MKATVKNGDLFTMAWRGLFSIDTSALDADEGYKVFKTIKALKKAYDPLEEQRLELIRSKISDEEREKAIAYEQAGGKSAEGLITAEEYKAIREKDREAQKAVMLLDRDTAEVEVRPIPFASYFSLKKANKGLKADMDGLLEGILWQDEEEQA